MGYRLEGDMLEVCNCEVLCPCWIGEDPDHGSCNSALAYRITSGEIGRLDVGGVVMASVVKIPGNVFAGGWRRQLYIDTGASDAQAEALVEAMTGRLGGPMAELAALVARRPAADAGRAGLRPARGAGALRGGGDRRGGDGALPRAGRAGDDVARQRLLDGAGNAGLCREGGALLAAASRARARPGAARQNAIQGSFRFEG